MHANKLAMLCRLYLCHASKSSGGFWFGWGSGWGSGRGSGRGVGGEVGGGWEGEWEGGGEEGGEKDRKNSAKKWYKDELMRKGQNTKEEAQHHTRAETNAKKRMRSRYTSLPPLPSIL